MPDCVIIGAAPDTDAELVHKYAVGCGFVVCADGGYITAKIAGVRPDLIIGDFDSSELPDGIGCEIIRLPVMKDDTDTMSCIKECLKRGCRDILMLGMTGGRADHTFANYTALLYIAKRGGRGTILGTEGISTVLCADASFTVNGMEGSGAAVFPIGCERCRVSLNGFLYGGEDILLTADFPLGASNTVTSGSATVTVHEGNALFMVCDK